MTAFTYLKNLVTDRNIASVAPTSTFGIDKVCRPIDFQGTKLIVEYGPATGVFTKHFLEHLRPDAKVIAIDTNANFLRILRKNISDPRLVIVNDTAEKVLEILAAAGEKHADYIVSGIPFSMLPPDVADRIVQNTHAALRDGGKFLVYQFLRPIGKKTKGIHRHLPNHFQDIRQDSELRNIPPLVIYEATKHGAGNGTA